MIDALHLRLFVARAMTIDTSWNAPNVQSTFWRFYSNAQPGAALERPEGLYPLEGGRLYFVPSGVRFSCLCTETIDHFYVHFDVIGLPGPVQRALFHSPFCLPSTSGLANALARLRLDLHGEGSVDLSRQCRLKALLYEGLGLYLDSLPPEQQARGFLLADSLAPVQPALRFIDSHLAEPLRNGDLASRCCLSEDHFIRRFRECVGQTPTRYILERRVTQAAQRLLFSDHSIERIAEETGFGNRFYFSRIFARRTGLAPAAYRKSSRI